MLLIKKNLKRFLLKYFFKIISYILLIDIKKYKKKGNEINLLVFSEERWRDDLKILNSFKNINLIYLPTKRVEIINALFNKDQNNKYKFLEFIKFLIKFRDINAAISCSCFYRREKAWAENFNFLKIPFIAYHKEFTVVSKDTISIRIKRIKKNFNLFPGYVCCVNKFAKKILIESGVVDKNKIKIVGLIRSDRFFTNCEKRNDTIKNKSIVFFSFGHFTGPFLNPINKKIYIDRDHYFSKNNKQGFVNLFNSTHAAFMKLALNNPEFNFFIKPKNYNKAWVKEIELVANKELNCNFDDIKNCIIVNERAYNLMDKSLANIVFNSTTVIESVLSNKNTIIPVYCEALNKYSNKILFKKYFDLFSIADSQIKFEELINKALIGKKLKKINKNLLNKLCNEHLGNSEGKSGIRFINVIKQII